MLRRNTSNVLTKKVNSIRSILIILSIFILLFTSIPSLSYAKSAKTLPLSKETVDGSPATGSSLAVANSKGYSIDQRYSPAGTIITEIKTGQILWDENSTVEWTPASMSKLMTIALTYDAIKEGKLSIDTVVPVKERHARVSANSNLSNNKMQIGASYTVGELMELIAVPSSAAATYMLMDLLAPDIDTFVTMMNNKAKELGMVNTKYVNPIGVLNVLLGQDGPSGDPYADNYTSAKDYACLCTYLVTNYPDLLNHTINANLVSKPGTPYEEHFEGHNYSLPGEKYAFPGADGIKTGSARKGYNYSLTAKQGNTRMIEIVLGVSVWGDSSAESMRHLIGNSILEDAFAKYEYRKVLSAGKYSVKGKIIEVKEDFYDCVPKDYKPKFICDFKNKKLKLNISNRQYLNGFAEPSASFDLVKASSENSAKAKGNGKSKPLSITSTLMSIFVISLVAAILVLIYTLRRNKRAHESRRRHRRR